MLANLIIWVFEAVSFGVIWFGEYHNPLFFRGNYVVIGLYAVFLFLITKSFNGYKLSYMRVLDLCLSHGLAIVIGGAVAYIFICMVSPLLVAALCMGRRQLRFFLFCIAGMGVCLLSAYINTFLAAVCQADALAATAEIAPVVEEMMKLLPLVFYLLVFEPESEKIKPAAITLALSFATFENVCYLIQNGADRFSFIFFRGFGTGAMHVLCGLIVGGGLAYTWQRTWLKVAGTCGLLGAAITLHAIYNLLIAYGGAAQYIAYALPVLLVAVGRLSAFRLSRRK